MRKEYDFSRGTRNRVAQRDWDDAPLSPAQLRELKRRAADLDDPIRYLLVSRPGPRFSLYYNVSDDVYAMNDPRGGTLFKRRNAASAVKRLLGPRIQIVRCTTKRERGARVPLIREPAGRAKARRT